MQATASYHFEGIARALQSISHQGESAGGTGTIFHREKFAVGGRVLSLPTLTGNQFRGLIRRYGVKFMLHELGDPTLTPAAFHFLTSGGALTKDSGRGLDMGQARHLRSLIPLVGVLGGACGRQIMEGKLQVGKWYPLCAELQSFIPERYWQEVEMGQSIYDFMQSEPYSRMDEAKSESWQQYLPEPQRALLEAPKTKVAKDGKEVAVKGVAQQMRYEPETMAAGTRFYLWMNLNDATPLEQAALASALYAWSQTPFVGGLSGKGHGLVELDLAGWTRIAPLAHFDESRFAINPAEEYREHLQSHKEEIMNALQEIV